MSASQLTAGETTGDESAGAIDRDGRGRFGDDRSAIRDAPTLVALAAVVAALSSVAGAAGAGCGIAAVAVWYAAGTPYAIALGYVALVGLFPNGIDPTSFAVTTAGFGALVLASAPPTARNGSRVPIRYAATALASAGTLGAVAWLAVGPAGRPLWLAAAATLAVLGCGVYGLHRYGLVFVLDRRDADRPESRARDRFDEPTGDQATDADRSSRDADADSTTEGEMQS